MLSEVTLEVALMVGNTYHRERGSRSVAGVIQETPSGR